MSARRTIAFTLTGLGLVALLAAPVLGQGRGGGGGGGGGGGAKARMDALTESFKLEKEQRKTIKTALDDAFKAGAPIRTELNKARAALVAAIAAGKPQTEIDEAAKVYGTQSAAMAGHEMKALAQFIEALTEEQRKNSAGISGAFFMFRNAFLDDKKWDDIPDSMKGY